MVQGPVASWRELWLSLSERGGAAGELPAGETRADLHVPGSQSQTFLFCLGFFFFWLCHTACGILVP